jgi:hypothetical protein
MIGRCTRQANRHGAAFYQARGITVCDRWLHSFENFLADMGERPAGMTLDRIDNNGNYEPGNCRWASPQQQFRNMRRNVWIIYNGNRMCLNDACSTAGVKQSTVSKKAVRKGISHQEAFDHYVARG